MATEKTCSKCGGTKDVEEFSRNAWYSDGLKCHCKECVNTYNREYKERNAERLSEKNIAYSRRYRKRTPVQQAAHRKVNNSIRDGKISPLPCWVCGARAEAHHYDYSTPLDVVWLCRTHHIQAHAIVKEAENDRNT